MPSDTWILHENLLAADRPGVGDILFTLGNGIIGVAGVPTLAPRGAQGMFAGGMYAGGPAELNWIPEPGHAARDNERFPTDEDIYPLRVKSLIACPRVFAVSLAWNGQKIDVANDFSRSLDLKTGTLTCVSTITLPGGSLTLTDRRLTSFDDLHLLAQRLEISSTVPGVLEVTLEIDATNKNQGKCDLWAARSVDVDGEALNWHGIAGDTGSELSICQRGRATVRPKFDAASPLTSAASYSLDLAAGQPAVIERFIGVGFTTYDAAPRSAAHIAAITAANEGFDACAERQRSHWQGFWDENDIIIDGSDRDQLAVRYSIFQLHSATPPPDGTISFGAKFLSGEWYRACVFWDTDVFIGPYLAKTQPDAARGHLLYRYRTLDEARKAAKGRGYSGACYPWESLPPTGENASVPWIVLGGNQPHINCDIAWAVADYFRWTGDTDFMENYGAEILAETARFWMSRVTRTKRGLEILDSCGPDEYHPQANNSIYNSVLVRENLKLAARYGKASEEEKRAWTDAADQIVRNQPNTDGVLEQYDGFFQLPDWRRDRYIEKAVEYQALKQADVVMLPILLPGLYPKEVVRANYEYYEPRTSHGSTLSVGAHAIVAAQLDMIDEAYDKFLATALMQLEDRLENTEMGLHAACIAMVPRVIMEGFAGLHIEGGKPAVSPHLPPAWHGIDFQFSCQGRRYRCSMRREPGKQETAVITRIQD